MNVINVYVVPQVANIFDMRLEAKAHMITASLYGRSHFYLYRHADNVFDFLIRDIDRQPKPQTGLVELIVYDDRNHQAIVTPLVVENAPRGHYRATLPNIDLPLGKYTWNIRHTDGATTRLLYTNQNYDVFGTLEVREGFPDIITPETVIDAFLPNTGSFVSSALSAASKTGNHSFALSLTNYTGIVQVEVSQDTGVPVNNEDWVTLAQYQYSDHTALVNQNLTGNYTFIRFRVSSISGLASITYRN